MRFFKFSVTSALITFTTLPSLAQTLSYDSVTSTNSGIKKKVICTATINSAEEKETFQRYLHPDYFEFVELLKDKKDTGFLTRTCRDANLKCDVVLVSGHFAGGFTNDKSFFLSSSDMEKLSCGSCPSVLNDATMVYLFGCNTLAGKQKDARTAEEYARVLRDEVGLDSADALATAAVRYSAIGDSFSSRLRRIFRGSAFIAGFGSKAPLGNQIEDSLGDYFRSLVPGMTVNTPPADWQRRAISEEYYKEIDRIAEGRANGRNMDLYKSGQRLQPTFGQKVGGHYTDVAGITASTTEDYVAKQYCSFYESKEAKLRAIEAIVQTNDSSAMIEMLPYLLEMAGRGKKAKPEQKALLARLSTNTNLRNVVLGEKGVLSQLSNAPLELLKTVDLATNLGWITDAESDEYYRQAAVFVWNHSDGLTKNKDLMARISDELALVQVGDITPTAFEKRSIWSLIQAYHKGDPMWMETARQNIDRTVKGSVRKYRVAEGEIRDYPLLSKGGVSARQKKMKDAGKELNEFCKMIKGIQPLASEIPTLLAHRAQDFETLGAGKCSSLLR